MPPYSKTTWVDGSLPAIDASKLNKIEQGIFDSLRQDGSTTMSGQLVTTAGSAATPAIAPTGDSNTGIFFPAADTIAFGEGGTEAMRINSSGQILINTTNTDSKVVIQSNDAQIMAFGNGNANAAEFILRSNSLSDPRGSLSVFGSASTINYQGLQPSTMTLYSTADIAINAESTKHIRFHTGTEKMRITSAGNVGIGTISPTYKLHVNESDTAVGSSNFVGLTSQSGGVFAIGVSDKSLANPIWNITTGSNEQLAFLVGATEKMRITSAGHVGIGTTSPDTVTTNTKVLHVEGQNYGIVLTSSITNAVKGQFITDGNGPWVAFGSRTNHSVVFTSNDVSRLIIEAAGTTRPAANNTYDLGSSSFRWATIYAQNALNTSDARLKTDVEPSSLGLDFIASLNPVQYRWIEGGNTVEKVQTGTETVEISPAIPAKPEVMDEEGNVIQEATQEVPAVTEEKPIYETVVTPREGVRTHFGLIAQEVKAALPDGLDFAGWCLADKDDADSTQSLGYTQLIAPMIKAIQELKAEIEALKAQLNK